MLECRVRIVGGRRENGKESDVDLILCFGPFEYDAARFELRHGSKVIPAEPQTLELISYLARNSDRLVSRVELFDAIWKGKPVTDWALSASIKAARVALKDDGSGSEYIKTVRGKGFRFVANVRNIADQALASDQATSAVSLIVVPFRNLSAKEDVDYLAEGFTEDLVNELSLYLTFETLSRNAAFRVPQQRPDDDYLSATFNVSHAISGSLRSNGER